MLYWLLYPLAGRFPVFNVFRYITFRSAMSAVTALLVALSLGPLMIRWLKRAQIGQSIREEGPKSHFAKAGTEAPRKVVEFRVGHNRARFF